VAIDLDGGGADFTIQFSGTVSGGPAANSFVGTWRNVISIVPASSNSVLTRGGGRYTSTRLRGSLLVGSDANWYHGPVRLASVGVGATGGSSGGAFLDNSGYIGLRFDRSGIVKYGAIGFEANDHASVGIIRDWAFDDSGNPMHVCLAFGIDAPVPEPGGLALLATGAAGLATLRKKRERA